MLSKNTLDGANTSMLKADTLAIIADYLETTTDYLLGRSDIPDTNISVRNCFKITYTLGLMI